MTNTETFFEVLKSHREAQNITISEICDFTKINPKYIEAIEIGDFTLLPNVYTRLFIKAYANFIDADIEKALRDYELYTTGVISDNNNFIENTTANDTKYIKKTNTNIDLSFRTPPKKIATGIIILLSIFFFLWWAGKITKEQTENIETNQNKHSTNEQPASIPDNNKDNTELQSKNLINSQINEKESYTNLPNQLPLNTNDFTLSKKHSELTKIVKIKKPYKISISILSETKMHLSKMENGNTIDLINRVVSSGETFNFNFTSTIQFEFWSNKHIKASLNDISIDNYLDNDDMAIRGSYESSNKQLYISFYTR